MVRKLHAISRRECLGFAGTITCSPGLLGAAPGDSAPLALGGRRELFIDDFLIARRTAGVEQRLHHPQPRDVVLVHDRPWEGSACWYHTIFRDGARLRMYYKAGDLTNEDGSRLARRPDYACYAESKDGIHWHRPELGLFEFAGSKQNNIIWAAKEFDNLSVFKDANPDCRPGEQYKGLMGLTTGLYALKSPDGVRWSLLRDKPILTRGHFDSQNTGFWDPLGKQYWCYCRDFHGSRKRYTGVRDIRVARSADFLTWSEPESLKYLDSPDEELYTNCVLPYYRAPHIFLGFPTRYVERRWSETFEQLPDPVHRRRRMKFDARYGTAITDCLFMTSRDGRSFQRWNEAFLRPGIERRHNWLYGDGYASWGLVETPSPAIGAPPELSMFFGEDYWKHAVRLRRYSLRLDGFVSVYANLKGGEVVTRSLTFDGRRLTLNISTSAAGNVRVEIQDSAGKPIPGFALADCDEAFGDAHDRHISWKGKTDIGALAGKPIRLRLALRDADMFALHFPA